MNETDNKEFEEFFNTEEAKLKPCPVQILNETSDPSPLLGDRDCSRYTNAIKSEQPRHRATMELAARGFTNKEIAELLGRTPAWVSNTLRQPSLQGELARVIRATADNVDSKVVEVIKKNVIKAVELYEKALGGDKSVTDVQMEAAERFLNRRYGKPNQPINRGTEVDLNDLSDTELAAMLPKTESTGTSQ